MIKKCLWTALIFWSLCLFMPSADAAKIKGIYITQYNFENTTFLNYLIKHSKAAGIDTFVVDLELIPSKRYEKNVQLLKENNIRYIARIIMFPDGGTPEQIKNPTIWQKKYRLVKQAVEWGASEIQLDYIRYSSKLKASDEHAKDILNIIKWYKDQLTRVPLQIDVFGITSFGESKHIGQNIQLFAESVDAICPMVYPSHYVPFSEHFKKPYETVYDSLKHIKKQFGGTMPIKLYAYIELSNYHYPMSHAKTVEYIKAQMKAVDDAHADGWFAWSPHNRYDNLFKVLEGENGTSQFEMDKLEANKDSANQSEAKKLDPKKGGATKLEAYKEAGMNKERVNRGRMHQQKWAWRFFWQ